MKHPRKKRLVPREKCGGACVCVCVCVYVCEEGGGGGGKGIDFSFYLLMRKRIFG